MAACFPEMISPVQKKSPQTFFLLKTVNFQFNSIVIAKLFGLPFFFLNKRPEIVWSNSERKTHRKTHSVNRFKAVYFCKFIFTYKTHSTQTWGTDVNIHRLNFNHQVSSFVKRKHSTLSARLSASRPLQLVTWCTASWVRELHVEMGWLDDGLNTQMARTRVPSLTNRIQLRTGTVLCSVSATKTSTRPADTGTVEHSTK